MQLIPSDLREQMLANGRTNSDRASRDFESEDFPPCVKLFCPWGAATWLLTELDPEEPEIAFGLCDLGMGCPELGRVSLQELEGIKGPGGLTIERDLHFRAVKTLSAYAAEARALGRITA